MPYGYRQSMHRGSTIKTKQRTTEQQPLALTGKNDIKGYRIRCVMPNNL